MGWEERDYHRDEGGSGRLFTRPGSMSVVTWLLVINAAVFLLDSIFTGSTRAGLLSLSRWGHFNIQDGIFGLQLWRWVTYQFLHGDLLHLVFNMIGLYFFGPMLEKWWGPRRFLAFYLLCGTCGALVLTGLAFVPGLLPGGTDTFVVGASGSVYGILVACAVLFPRQQVQLLFPPIPMTMRTMALVFLGIAALSLIAGSRNAGGEAAHLGGALLGFALARRPSLLNWADRVSMPQRPPGQRLKRKLEKQAQADAREDAEVDRILAKVREHGLHSLTRGEQKTLKRATDRQRRAG